MRAPAVVPALALIAGVATGVSSPGARPLSVLLLVACCGASLWAWRSAREKLLAACLIVGFCSSGVVFGAVAARNALHPPLLQFFHDQSASSGLSPWPLTVEGRLRADATPTDYGASIVVDVERLRTPCGWLPASGGARLAVNGTLVADAIASWRQGRRLRIPVTLRPPSSYRNPGVADEAFALARRGIVLVGSVKSARLVEVVAQGSPWQEAAGWARAYVRRAIRSAMPRDPRSAPVVTAIVIGDRSGLDIETTRRLQEAGTYHVIAISGGNIAILSALALLLLRFVRARGRSTSVLLAVLLCAYGYTAGGGPSVVRATIAAAVYLVVTAADHRSPAANVLATAALLAVVHDPLEVFDPGMVLSYGATLGLLLGAARMSGSRVGGTLVAGALAILIGTIGAELALFPVAAALFHRVTLAGMLLNFVAIPLMTVAQVAGLAIVVLTPVSDLLARACGSAASLSATGLIESTRLLDVAPWLTWRVPTPPIWVVAVYYSSWICVLWMPMRTAGKRITASVCAAGGVLICVPAAGDLVRPDPQQPRELKVTFLDVGQGDAILAQFPGGRSMLIDAAGLAGSAFDLGERVITPSLLALGIRRLDFLAITHGDPDHVAGAQSVARAFKPRELWEGIEVPPNVLLNELREGVARLDGILRTVRPDDRVEIAGASLRVLHPSEPDWERQRVRNDDSIVLELTYGDVSIVLPGDVGSAIEQSLAARLAPVPLRVLKAAHHGSASSTSQAWLDASHPAAVVFTSGSGNRYGHPHPSVLDRVRAHGAQVFRTDEDGAVTVTTTGRDVEIRSFLGRQSRITTKSTKSTKSTKEGNNGTANNDSIAR